MGPCGWWGGRRAYRSYPTQPMGLSVLPARDSTCAGAARGFAPAGHRAERSRIAAGFQSSGGRNGDGAASARRELTAMR